MSPPAVAASPPEPRATLPKVSGVLSTTVAPTPLNAIEPSKTLPGSVSTMVPVGAVTVLFPLTLSGPVCVIFPLVLVALSVLAVALPRSTLPLAPTVSAPGVLTTPRVRLPGTFWTVTSDPLRDNAESN